MEAIVAIVKPCLEPVATKLGEYIVEPVATKLGEYIVGPFYYLYCYNSNIENLKVEARNLEDARKGLEMQVTTAQRKVEVIVPAVNIWLEKAKELVQDKTTGILSRSRNIQSDFLAIKSRISLSREAKETTEAMQKLRATCNFNPISQPVPSAAIEPIPLGSTYEFESRKHIEVGIMITLRGNKVNMMGLMIGICGMGGVGKTTIAKRIMNRVSEEHLFDEIVMVVVSQQAEGSKIQDEIAKQLGLTLEKEDTSSRARKLRARLIGGKRILIVLDDVWENLKLEDLGIPCESSLKGCTILLTSRDSKIFEAMNVHKVYELKVLFETEAWDLFESNVGTCIKDDNVRSTAQKVVKECRGLPLALVIVGAALKNEENTSIWTDALLQLQNANPIAMEDVLDRVYKPLRLSYEYLKNEQSKSLFLLCGLFREDDHIPLKYLAGYAMGLGMFEDIRNWEEARNRTYSLVGMLKNRFLLLEGWNKHHVRMHDVIRDVSIFIVSEKRRSDCNNCTWISPFLGTRIEFSIPNPRLLLIDRSADEDLEIKDNVFKEMRGLNVLSMTYDSMRSLPDTTQSLNNLRTLLLLSCTSLETISVVGKLESLEILICRHCDSIENLPVEIGRLNGLKLLEFSRCRKLKTIAPGVISSLVKLEELKMVDSFDKWEAEDEGKERKNAALSELQFLSKLTCLEIEIEDYTLAAEQINLPSKIVKYDITIGNSLNYIFKDMEFERKMFLHLRREITLGNWIHECVRSVEYIWLKGDGSNNLDMGQAQNMIRSLALRECSTVKKLMNITSRITTVFPRLESLELDDLPKLEEICDGPIPEGSPNSAFKNLKDLTLKGLPALKHLWKNPNQNVVSLFGNNLSSIYIKRCDSLHNLSSLALANDCLLQLESLEIWNCAMMEQVLLWNEEENGNDITFPKLKSLILWNLPNLTTFCKGIESIEFPLLTILKIYHCPKLKSVVSVKDFLLQLERLKIRNCEMMEQVLLWNEEENRKDITFPKLKSLDLYDLPNLTTFCKGIESIEFPLLTSLEIKCCPKLKSVVSAKDFLLQLESLEIWNCEMMEQVLLWNEEENGKDITFPKLKSLTLWNLPNLTTFCKGIESIEFPLLTSLTIKGFSKLKSVVSSITSSTGNNQNNSEGTSHNHDHDFFHLFCKLKKAKDCLLQLESLVIWNCKMMEQVLLWNEEENGKDITFPKLKRLILCDLPNLTTFCKGIESIKFPLLTEMTIWSCPQLKSVVASSTTSSIGNNNQNNSEGTSHNHDHDSFHLFCEPEKVAFGSLKKLDITANKHPILTLWCHQISFGFFTGLEELEISGFDNIRSLFSSSIAGNLVNLNDLKISHCGKMVKVIEDDEEKDACGGESTICLFPRLGRLILSSLSNLKIFWEWRCALELPSLGYLMITECPQIERFTLGSLTTPNLKEIKIDYKNIINTDDLNGMLQQHFLRAKESTLGEETEEEEEKEGKDEEKEEEGDEGEEKQEQEREQEEMKEKEREEDQKKQGEIEEEEN